MVERPTIWVSFATDLSLIVIMLVGLQKHKGSGKLWKLVFHQVCVSELSLGIHYAHKFVKGVIWCIVALICYLPSAVSPDYHLTDLSTYSLHRCWTH